MYFHTRSVKQRPRRAVRLLVSLRDGVSVSEHFAFMCNDEEPPERSEHRAFEGLQADECGILNGCENGRCVRVQEGYTCDCFDGFALDLSRMACVGKTGAARACCGGKLPRAHVVRLFPQTWTSVRSSTAGCCCAETPGASTRRAPTGASVCPASAPPTSPSSARSRTRGRPQTSVPALRRTLSHCQHLRFHSLMCPQTLTGG